jgi:hypothetical protein
MLVYKIANNYKYFKSRFIINFYAYTVIYRQYEGYLVDLNTLT